MFLLVFYVLAHCPIRTLLIMLCACAARSSTDLNQSVAQSPDLGAANDASTPVPDEEIGYLASEQYALVILPQPTGTSTPGNSPTLRRGDSEDAPVSLYGIVANSSTSISTSIDEKDKEISIHLDALPHRGGVYHHHYHHDSRAGTRPGSALGMMGEDEEDEEHEHPILASDEVQKRGGEFMLPAISPPLPPRRPGSMPNTRPHSVAPTGPCSDADDDDEEGDIEPADLSGGTGFELRESLIALQPGEETEPLFPEDEDEDVGECVAGTVDNIQEKLKRLDLPPSVSSGHRFPSKDIWEEAPDHAHLQAIVSSPPTADVEAQDDSKEEEKPAERTSSTPEYVQGQPHDHYEPGDEKEFEQRHKDAKKKAGDYRHEVQSEGPDEHLDRLLKRGKKGEESTGSGDRNGVKRFPSNDIWEDVPPSLQLSTTVTPSNDHQEGNTNEHESRATTTGTTRPGDKITSIPEEENTRPTARAPVEGSSTTEPGSLARPQVPSTRPARKVPPQTGDSTFASSTGSESAPISPDKKAPPGLPDRPKPKVPARPNKPATTIVQSSSTESPPAASGGPSGGPAPGNVPPVSSKPKPAIPPRTGGIGGKIAALKAGFMNDLDQRLKLGPQAPKQEEKPAGEEEDTQTEVLGDVRKSRAKGPRGRKLPTAKEVETKTETKADPAAFKMEIVGVWTVWSMDDKGVNVGEDSAISSTSGSRTEPNPNQAEGKKNAAPTPSATTLPGATGTGQPAAPAVGRDVDTSVTSPASGAEEKKEKDEIPTAIPGGQHPGDAIETSEVGDERVGEVKQEGVGNTAGDQKVGV